MKLLLLNLIAVLALAVLASCAGATVELTDLDGKVHTSVEVKGGLRRVRVEMNDKGEITVTAGQMLINDETVQAGIKEAAPILTPKGN